MRALDVVISLIGWFLAAVLFLVALLTGDSGWAVTAATVILATVTIFLGGNTRSLVRVTDQLAAVTSKLAKIEERRDLKVRIEDALKIIEEIRRAFAEELVGLLAQGSVDHTHIRAIHKLAAYRDLLEEPTRRMLDEITKVIDDTEQGKFMPTEGQKYRIRDTKTWSDKITVFQAHLATSISQLQERLRD